MRIKAALKAKQVQPRTNKVYLMKWPESISHNFPSSSSHRLASAVKTSVPQECAVILFTITWKLFIYHTCWSCSGWLNSFTSPTCLSLWPSSRSEVCRRTQSETVKFFWALQTFCCAPWTSVKLCLKKEMIKNTEDINTAAQKWCDCRAGLHRDHIVMQTGLH